MIVSKKNTIKKARQTARKRQKHNQYRNQLIKDIKNVVKKNTYPPAFDNTKWNNENKRNKNCYAYALDININDPKAIIWYPGCISSGNISKSIWDYEDIVPRIKRDLEVLGFKYREDGFLRDGEYRIAIYYGLTTYDYPTRWHIARQNVDGFWSEKKNWIDEPVRMHNCSDTPTDLTQYGFILDTVLILSKKKETDNQ